MGAGRFPAERPCAGRGAPDDTLLAAVAGGSVFRAFEASNQRLSEWDGIYWAFTAMTTLGSEYTATTVGGQITEVVILLVGISS